jgi:benzaldehyde dehydrogenase (NAD)
LWWIKVADEFIAKFAAKASSLPLGDPRKGPVVLGSVVDLATVERCNAMIDDALAKGARSAAARPRHADARHADRPCDAGDAHLPRETFGPVKGIVRVNGEEEAIAGQ